VIFPHTPKYDGQAPPCPTSVGPMAFVLSLLGSAFPRTPSYASPPPPESVEIEADGGDPVDTDAPCESPLPSDDVRRVVVHADQVPQPLRDMLRRLFAVND
jgi:hypothetical protein